MTLVTIDTAALGRKGGRARAKNLSGKQLSESARNAVNARWDQWLKDNPDKAAEALARRAKRAGIVKKKAKKKAGKK